MTKFILSIATIMTLTTTTLAAALPDNPGNGNSGGSSLPCTANPLACRDLGPGNNDHAKDTLMLFNDPSANVKAALCPPDSCNYHNGCTDGC